MIIFFAVFFLVYGSINYYIFIRGWQALQAYPFARPFYLVIFLVAALSYILTRVLSDYLPSAVYDFMLWVGSFWFAYMAYFFLAVLLIDIIRLVNWKLSFFPGILISNYAQGKFIIASVIFLIVTIVVIAGFINTRNINIVTHDITVPKGAGKLDTLNIVMASDIHISPLNNNDLIKGIVDKINALNPDIVLFPGDIVDDYPRLLKQRGIGNPFRDIKSRYGIFASTGNHEYINGASESIKYITDLGITVLQDTAHLIDNGFYLVAREDTSKINFSGGHRKTLAAILETADKNYPTILMDHTPFKLQEAADNGISLQLSGHTHNGQIFPGNLITKMVYEVSWGYLKKGNTHIYVSSGAGTWGPPVRNGSNSEIVNFRIRFQ